MSEHRRRDDSRSINMLGRRVSLEQLLGSVAGNLSGRHPVRSWPVGRLALGLAGMALLVLAGSVVYLGHGRLASQTRPPFPIPHSTTAPHLPAAAAPPPAADPAGPPPPLASGTPTDPRASAPTARAGGRHPGTTGSGPSDGRTTGLAARPVRADTRPDFRRTTTRDRTTAGNDHTALDHSQPGSDHRLHGGCRFDEADPDRPPQSADPRDTDPLTDPAERSALTRIALGVVADLVDEPTEVGGARRVPGSD